MDRRFLALAFIGLFLLSSLAVAETPAVQGSTSTLGFLRIKNESYYSPFPAEPGNYVDVWIAVRNLGKNPISAECRVQPSFPFSLDSAGDGYQDLGVLEEQREVLLKYHVRVDERAVEGYNDLNFGCRDKTGGASAQWSGAVFPIFVQPHDATLAVSSVQSVPAEIAPGQGARVSITLKNLANIALKDVRVKLDVSGDKVPFTPVGGTSEAKVASVGPGEGVTVSFEVVASPGAESGPYKIPIQLNYLDKLGKQYSRNETTGLVVASEPMLQVIASSDKIFKAGVRGKISFKLVNNGLSDVKLAWVVFSPSASDVKLLSAPQAYVGTISSDNYETVDFDVFVEENASLPLRLPVAVSFRDSSNKAYERSFEPELPVFSQEEAQRVQLESPQGTNIVLLAIGAIIALYLLLKYALPAARGLFPQRGKKGGEQ
ncbi:MAG: hypothetical protein WC792_00880 [Candidatus Micrarchaeia archaeon]|jgi:hypothetical protein